MTVDEKITNDTFNNNGAVCGIKIRCPKLLGAKCSKKMNAFFDELCRDFTALAKKKGGDGDIFSFDFVSVYSTDSLCSIFFEKSVRNGRYITAYTPFSVTFLQKNGIFIPLYRADASLSSRFQEVKGMAKRNGISISFSEFSRCYYLNENGAVIYRSVFVPDKQIRKTSECVRKFYISSDGSSPSLCKTDTK